MSSLLPSSMRWPWLLLSAYSVDECGQELGWEQSSFGQGAFQARLGCSLLNILGLKQKQKQKNHVYPTLDHSNCCLT